MARVTNWTTHKSLAYLLNDKIQVRTVDFAAACRPWFLRHDSQFFLNLVDHGDKLQ